VNVAGNQYGPLASDAPHRGEFWSVIDLPRRLDFVPIVDVHTGFHFSRIDQNWNFLRPKTRRGVFPIFSPSTPNCSNRSISHFAIIASSSAPASPAITGSTALIQQYDASPNYGTFYNSMAGLFRIDGDSNF
jgi:hypothetical protein